ncbi:MAG: hypothetical protein ABI212_00565 [Burkholderiaceae bacterium]
MVLSQSRWSLAAAYSVYRLFEQALLEDAECVIATSEPYLEASAALKRWRHKCLVVPVASPPRCCLTRQAAALRGTDVAPWQPHMAGFDWGDPTSGFRYCGTRAIQLLASRDANLFDDAGVGV